MRLKQANLTLKLSKCVFAVPRIEYLGHVLDGEGIHPQTSKFKAITSFPAPKTVKQVRRFLGMTGYYRRFIVCWPTKDISDGMVKEHYQ